MGWHRASTKFGFRFRRAKMLVEVRDGSARTAKWSGPALSVWRRAALALLGIHRWPAVPRDHWRGRSRPHQASCGRLVSCASGKIKGGSAYEGKDLPEGKSIRCLRHSHSHPDIAPVIGAVVPLNAPGGALVTSLQEKSGEEMKSPRASLCQASSALLGHPYRLT